MEAQVRTLKSSVAEVLKAMGPQKKAEKKEAVEEGAVAKALEEMKLIVRELPMRLEQRSRDPRTLPLSSIPVSTLKSNDDRRSGPHDIKALRRSDCDTDPCESLSR